mmetsp:Transcript_26366/g.62863  ORF Transcript_26366/g.62863 Transcript_26366/m.62863 type:complete len:313 (+) Transcript_26366:292-1230(+)
MWAQLLRSNVEHTELLWLERVDIRRRHVQELLHQERAVPDVQLCQGPKDARRLLRREAVAIPKHNAGDLADSLRVVELHLRKAGEDAGQLSDAEPRDPGRRHQQGCHLLEKPLMLELDVSKGPHGVGHLLGLEAAHLRQDLVPHALEELLLHAPGHRRALGEGPGCRRQALGLVLAPPPALQHLGRVPEQLRAWHRELSEGPDQVGDLVGLQLAQARTSQICKDTQHRVIPNGQRSAGPCDDGGALGREACRLGLDAVAVLARLHGEARLLLDRLHHRLEAWMHLDLAQLICILRGVAGNAVQSSSEVDAVH